MTISMTKRYLVTGNKTVIGVVYVPSHITDVETYIRHVEKRGADGEIFKPWNRFETIKFREIK